MTARIPTLDLTPRQRERTHLEDILQSFGQEVTEKLPQYREQSAVRRIRQSKDKTLDQIITDINSDPDIMPATRINLIKEMTNNYERYQQDQNLIRSGMSPQEVKIAREQPAKDFQKLYNQRVRPQEIIDQIAQERGLQEAPQPGLLEKLLNPFQMPSFGPIKPKEAAGLARKSAEELKGLGRTIKEAGEIAKEDSQKVISKLREEGPSALTKKDYSKILQDDFEALSKQEKGSIRRNLGQTRYEQATREMKEWTPFIGEGLARKYEKERGLEEVPRTKGLPAAIRLAGELATLGKLGSGLKTFGVGSLGTGLAEGAALGGGETISQAIGGDKLEPGKIAVLSAAPFLIRLGGKGFKKLYDKAIRVGGEGAAADLIQKTVQAAEEAGVNFEKAAAGNAKEARKWRDITKTFAAEESEGLRRGAQRTARVKATTAKPVTTKEFAREVNAYKINAKEVQEEIDRLAKRRSKFKETTSVQYQRQLPELESKVNDLHRRWSDLHDARQTAEKTGKWSDKQLRENKLLLRQAEKELALAEEELYKAQTGARSGDIRLTNAEYSRRADMSIAEMLKDAETLSKEELLKKYQINPTRIETAKRLPGRLGMGRGTQEDSFIRANKVYNPKYQSALQDISEKLKSPNLKPAERQLLEKQKEILDLAMKDTRAKAMIQQRRKALQRMEESRGAKQKTREAKPLAETSKEARAEALKVSDTLEGKLKNAMNSSSAEDAAKQAEEAVREAIRDLNLSTKTTPTTARQGVGGAPPPRKNIRIRVPDPGALLSRALKKGGIDINPRSINTILSAGFGSTVPTWPALIRKAKKSWHRNRLKSARTPAEKNKIRNDLRKSGKSESYINSLSK